MKLKIKILKENKQKLSEGRYDGLYDVAGIYPGSIDLFIKHFAEVPIEISMDRKDFIESSFGQEIEALRDEDIPRTSARSSKTPLDKVKNALRRGHTYWWNEIFGPQMAETIIQYKVFVYLTELEEKLNAINYSTQTSEEFQELPEQEKALVYEKHFLEDYLDSFFGQHVKMSSMNTTGYVGNPGVGSGLYGQMADWWMSTEGADIMKSIIKDNLSALPQR